MKDKEVYIEMTLKNHEVELLRKIIETQENEREKIAKDIHDDLGPRLTIIKLNLTSLKKSNVKNTVIENTMHEIDDVISEFRSISSELSPTHVIKYGLLKAISHVLNQISDSTEIQCSFSNINNTEEFFEKQLSINIYRIYSELINNLLKHAFPNMILVQTEIHNNKFILSIKHDGNGLSNDDFMLLTGESDGQGISSINSRIVLVNGEIKFLKGNKFSEIKLSIPLEV